MSKSDLITQGQHGLNGPWQKAVLFLLKNIADTTALPISGFALETTQVLVKNALNSGSFSGNSANFVAGKTASMTNTSDTAVIAAPGAAVSLYITHIMVTNGHATVSTYVNLKDGSTTVYTGYASAAGGGFSVTLPTPLVITANTALNAACETTASDVRVSASGYKK